MSVSLPLTISITITLDAQDIHDLREAIRDAQNELCLAPNMTESLALNKRWELLEERLSKLSHIMCDALGNSAQ